MDWASVLVQVPVIAAFIWFVLEQDKRSCKAMEKRDEQWRSFLRDQSEANSKAMEKVATKLDNLHSAVEDHDHKLTSAIAVMQARLER